MTKALFRRVPRDALFRHHPKRPWSEIEAFVSIDEDWANGGLKPLNFYARLFGHSRNWCRTRMVQYADILSTQDRKGFLESVDRQWTSVGQMMDRQWTPSERGEKRESSSPDLLKTEDPPKKKHLCPDELPLEAKKRIRAWAKTRGFTESQLGFAWAQVRDWSRGKGEKRIDWEAVLRRGIREGWALKGYQKREVPPSHEIWRNPDR